MHHRLKTFLLCLLFVTLPIQSIAGVAQFACSMAHHQVDPDRAQQVVYPTPEISANLSDIVTSGDDAASGDCERMRSHKGANCGTCSGCCIGSYAPPPVFSLAAVQDSAVTAKPKATFSFTGHFPPRLERPPRSSHSLAS